MIEVRWSASALDDLRSIFAYVRERSRQGAATIATRIEVAERSISVFPRAARQDAESGTFEYVLPGLPYLLIYELVRDAAAEEFALIIAVFHTSRDPSAKPHRRAEE